MHTNDRCHNVVNTDLSTEQFRMTDKSTLSYIKDYETVIGNTYINKSGREECVGFTKQAKEAIGLPVEVMEDCNRRIKKLKNINHVLTDNIVSLDEECRAYQTMSLWDRIKFVFKKNRKGDIG